MSGFGVCGVLEGVELGLVVYLFVGGNMALSRAAWLCLTHPSIGVSSQVNSG